MKTIFSLFFILCFNYMANAQVNNWLIAKPGDMEAVVESQGFKILEAWDGLPDKFNNTVIFTKSASLPGLEDVYDPKETVIINKDGIKNLLYEIMSCQSVVKTYHCIKTDISYNVFLGNTGLIYAIAEAPGTKMFGYIAIILDRKMSDFATYELSMSQTEAYIKSVEEKADNTGEVKDIDGNIYKTVKIGKQIWLAQNLKTTKFADGMPIPTITKGLDKLKKSDNPVYQWAYDNNQNNVEDFGRLYSGWAVMKGNVCPAGWHVPDESEWNTLIDFLGGKDVAGGKLKYPSENFWVFPEDATDEVWFKAIGAGCLDMVFKDLKMNASFYTKSGSSWYLIGTAGKDIFYHNYQTQAWSYIGRSIRCIKD